MECAVGVPSRWVVRFHSGETIELGADGYTEADGYLIFGVLVNATTEEKDDLERLWQVRYGPQRTEAIIAKIPAAAVADVWAAES
ncbi:hypothetical protein [Streptosporangium sp. NPDC051022]|uniref:hypothetical protein n=1 Tax=Streptosporangium sp. NPDC051022 TaxID=3155752 RepID=UPI003435BE3A